MSFTSGVATHDRRAWVDVNGNRHSTYLAQLRKGQTIEQYYRKRGARYAPRPEFDNHNPVLVAFREDFGKHSRTGNVSRFASDCLRYWRETNNRIGTPEQIDHARRVLTKLAALV